MTTSDLLNDLPEVLTIGEVAKVLRLSKITLKRWGKKGKLVPIRVNTRGDRRYLKKDIIEFLSWT